MYVYHDFNYVNHILKLEFIEGLSLYETCLSRINEQKEVIEDNRLWQAFINSEFDGTFDQWKETKIGPAKGIEEKKLGSKEKLVKQDEIIEKTKDLRAIIEAQDEKRKLKKVVIVER